MRGKNEFKRVLERRRRRRSRSCGQNADRNVDKTWMHDFCAWSSTPVLCWRGRMGKIINAASKL